MNQTDMTEPETTWPDESETAIPAESSGSHRLPEHKGSLLLPALLLLLVGGLIGYAIGRQSAAGAAAETAVRTIVPTAPAAISASSANAGSTFSSAPTSPTPASIIPETVRALGDPNAPVTVVEFSDYQCPFCLRHFQQTIPQLKAEYIDTGRVYYVFKDFPITSLHPVAPRIHEAARCAGEIGGSDGYWQAHDSFFNNSQQLTDLPQPDLDNRLVALLSEVELNEESVRECLESGRYSDEVNADLAEGQRLGVNGTPGFFVNGYPVPGAQPYEVFQQVIAMAEAGRLAEAYSQAPGPNDGKARATATALAAQPADVPLGDEPAKGSPDAPITIVEYSDFQCPFCLRHFQQTLPSCNPI